MRSSSSIPAAAPHLIEVKVAEIHQLFNSMDPSPFHERDLDHDAEQFILSWAQECPSHAALKRGHRSADVDRGIGAELL